MILDRRSRKALKLAIAALTDRRRKYAACPHAAEQGFEFGRQGLVHYKECDDAINLFSEWLSADPKPTQPRLFPDNTDRREHDKLQVEQRG